ncbi:demethoxyubiquinone hydroxylase family protein [Methyloversatilis sp.]|uniref:demethoxyubiquinone hydroxylase family protein n=1 Tax=Methyloversatilis sp. TaxID=2569862 RepID=UPI002736351E|nr:demethoxyubiquinone hydroxylase family protein [Methyloversatilis sp.]MDP2867199.1 demethoxyubiquinone hydroxylase family protein [Methyloversatilis sp.]MDP3453992.1 demethoxyubiquinone hydroxylase family protein [Methyloversatilis sp.]MDP3578756.1 demethoxyubiquinone hydroxylase family protein [Methyloversatilis sp.]
MTPTDTDSVNGLTVLYDGDCPLCRREVGVYRGLRPLRPLHWVDVSDTQVPLPTAGDRASYLARFHVRRDSGEVLSGARAFIALWAALPGWRWLARAGALPGVASVLEVGYRGFLRVRPSMQRVARALDTPGVPDELIGELRSDHAGETGAVWIYRGILAVSRDPVVREFAQRHGVTEQQHLERISALLPPLRRSVLLPGWRVAGFLTGALPALFGARAVFGTIGAVETFVDHHYQQQIDRLPDDGRHTQLRALLVECQADECAHRDEALSHGDRPDGWLMRTWCALVGSGSAFAVTIARRL